MNFGIPPTFCHADGLCFPASGWIQPALMHLHMARVDIHGVSLKRWRDKFPELLPQLVAAPATIVLIDRIPARLRTIDRPPGAALTQHKKNTSQHDFDW